jgi:hypothetical protein
MFLKIVIGPIKVALGTKTEKKKTFGCTSQLINRSRND